jgi:hypothetical protein
MTTISNQNGSFAPEPFQLLLFQPQSTTVSTLQEALNSTTRRGTIATCRLSNTETSLGWSDMLFRTHNPSERKQSTGTVIFSLGKEQTIRRDLTTGLLLHMECVPLSHYRNFYERDPYLPRPSYFMRGTADEIWGEDMHGVMRTTAENWTDDREGPTY